MIFNVSITNKENGEMVDEYKEVLQPVVTQIYDSLQAIDSNERTVNYDVVYQTTNKLPSGYGYFIEKISEFIYGAGYPPSFWEPCLKEIFKDHFIMEYSSYEELYILIISCINKLNRN